MSTHEKCTITLAKTFNAFTPFPRLPIEIRLIIWKLVPQPARIIKVKAISDLKSPVDVTAYIKHTFNVGGSSRYEAQKLKLYPKGVCYIPAMLHTNQEARAVASQNYTLGLDFHLRGQPVFFNWERDFVYLPDSAAIVSLLETRCMPFSFFDSLEHAQESAENNLAIPRMILNTQHRPWQDLIKLRYMHSLQYVIFKVNDVETIDDEIQRMVLECWMEVYFNGEKKRKVKVKYDFMTEAEIITMCNPQ